MQESRQRSSAGAPKDPSAGAPADASQLAEAETDRRLVAGLKAGHHGALAGLYDRHAPAMMGLAVRMLRDRGDAEDLVHDVFLEAWSKAASFSPERGRVRTWLLVRLRSRAIDRLRSLDVAQRHARSEASARDAAPPHRSAEDPVNGPDRRRARAALAALPDSQRVVLELAYFEGLSCSEIAERCDAPLGTVKSRLLAGMRELRRLFGASEVRDGAG